MFALIAKPVLYAGRNIQILSERLALSIRLRNEKSKFHL
jgi:hypothetical protein